MHRESFIWSFVTVEKLWTSTLMLLQLSAVNNRVKSPVCHSPKPMLQSSAAILGEVTFIELFINKTVRSTQRDDSICQSPLLHIQHFDWCLTAIQFSTEYILAYLRFCLFSLSVWFHRARMMGSWTCQSEFKRAFPVCVITIYKLTHTFCLTYFSVIQTASLSAKYSVSEPCEGPSVQSEGIPGLLQTRPRCAGLDWFCLRLREQPFY